MASRAQPPLRPNELALLGIAATLFLLALGALVGIGLASVLFGAAWVWPHGAAGAAHQLGALLTGRLHDRRVPGTATVWTVVVLVELAVLGAAVLFARWAAGVLQPDRTGALKNGALKQGAPKNGALKQGALKHEIAAAFGRRRPDDTAAWRLGRAAVGVDVWLPYARSVGVVGPPGSGKTLDVVTPAVLAAPAAVVQTASRPDDVLLTLTRRPEPVVVFDPLGALPGLAPLVWDPLHGCIDSTAATRRARAFCPDDDDATKVLQCYVHAAALTGRTIDHVLTWVADPLATDVPETILREHPHAQEHWADLLHNALRRPPTAALQHAMDALLHKEIAKRVLPSARRPATDVGDVLRHGGTVYLLGADDHVVTVSPLLTAVADDVIAAARPDTVVVLDGLLSVPARPPNLIWTAAAPAAADVLVHVGAGPAGLELQSGEAAVVATGVAPFVVRLQRPTDGTAGAALLADAAQARARATAAPDLPGHSGWDPVRSALVAAREHGLHPDTWRQR